MHGLHQVFLKVAEEAEDDESAQMEKLTEGGRYANASGKVMKNLFRLRRGSRVEDKEQLVINESDNPGTFIILHSYLLSF